MANTGCLRDCPSYILSVIYFPRQLLNEAIPSIFPTVKISYYTVYNIGEPYNMYADDAYVLNKNIYACMAVGT